MLNSRFVFIWIHWNNYNYFILEENSGEEDEKDDEEEEGEEGEGEGEGEGENGEGEEKEGESSQENGESTQEEGCYFRFLLKWLIVSVSVEHLMALLTSQCFQIPLTPRFLLW